MTYPSDQSNPAAATPMYAAGNSFDRLSTAATHNVKTTPGILRSVVVNTPDAGSTVELLDGATSIALIDTATVTGTFTYDVACATSIVVIIAGGTPDITVTYR